MQPVTRVITTDPEVIPLNTYGRVGFAAYTSNISVQLSALADKNLDSSIIGSVTNGVWDSCADGVLVTSGVGETVIISQYGD